MAILRSTLQVTKHESDKPYTDDSYAMLQARGFARRHGWAIVDAEGHTDVPMDDETSSSRSDDLSSPGVIDRKPPDAARRQTSMGISTSSVADKANKKASGAQKCHKCGSCWIGHKANCEACGTAMDARNDMIKGCPHGVTTKRTDGTMFCNGCNKVWPDEQSFVAERERQRVAGDSDATDKSAGTSNDLGTRLRKMFNDQSNPELARDLFVKVMFKKAAVNPQRAATYEALGQIADALDLNAGRFRRNESGGPIRLSTGRRGGGGRHGDGGWISRHF